MGKYKLTKAAALDFERIFEFGIDTFGIDQALKYQNELKQQFDILSDQPKLYPLVEHIHKSFRRSVCGSHSIYYRIEQKRVIIVRILGQQNPERAF
ncbi:MAG: type II toxin-antitoxin system RelE/ParE family toxin [Rhodospirillales bacterium]|nr:type II toxin-antitoxin system RelE/ParE family toxin [Rhodospirillales bacterium]